MRNSDERCNSIGSQGSSSSGANPKIRLAVFGQHEVGKSALTVRYLTKRFIGEYKSNTDLLYNQTVTIGQNSIDVEIVDISTSAGPSAYRRKSFPIEEIQRADGFVIVYSITDRASFTFAQEALETITNYHSQNQNQNGTSSSSPNSSSTSSSSNASTSSSPNSSPQPRASCPILLVGNKQDLEHLRVVEKVEGISTAMQFGSHFYELSVAENSPEVYTSFQNLISTFITQNKEPSKRKFSVSKMLGNLRIGKSNSSNNHVFTSQASVVDTDILSNSHDSSSCVSSNTEECIPSDGDSNSVGPSASPVNISHQRQSSVPDNQGSSNLSSSFCSLKSKIIELHSMKRRHNSPPICSL